MIRETNCNHDAKPPVCFGHEMPRDREKCPEDGCQFVSTARGVRMHKIHFADVERGSARARLTWTDPGDFQRLYFL